MAQILYAPPNNGFSAFWKQTILDLAPFGNKRKIVIHIFQSSKKKMKTGIAHWMHMWTDHLFV